MTDGLELNVDTLGEALRKQASGVRRLANGILDGEFRRGLLSLAADYDAQATKVERKTAPGGISC